MNRKKVNNDEIRKCKKCNRTYKTDRGLRKHYDAKHKHDYSSYGKYVEKCVKTVSIKSNDNSGVNSKNSKTLKNDDLISLVKKLEKDVTSLRKDISKLKTVLHIKKYCVVCWERESDFCTVPCGHKMLCKKCSLQIYKQKNSKCLICNKKVKNVIKVYNCGIE